MVQRRKAGFIVLTFFPSVVAALLSLTSLFTPYWIEADGRVHGQILVHDSNINYGLFGGTYDQEFWLPFTADILMTCSISENACALICSKNTDRNEQVLRDLLLNHKTDWSIAECPRTETLMGINGRVGDININLTTQASVRKKFIDYRGYILTIGFLFVSIALGLISSFLSISNTISNPRSKLSNIRGLYIFNISAFCTLLSCSVLWGVIYCGTLSYNPAFVLVLTDQMTIKSVQLGWSYWINYLSMFLYALSIGILYTRSYLVAHETKQAEEVPLR